MHPKLFSQEIWAKLEKYLPLSHSEHGGPDQQLELTGDLTERVASDVNYLNHCVSKCEASAFVEEIRPRINIIGKIYFNLILFSLIRFITQVHKLLASDQLFHFHSCTVNQD